ncbi:hypothetical protein BSL78_01803 [Apostichopus japonicus]|uniref:Uncharacterized protein n=1 Tax=Stichopus japonicus TaxID=307972 RepID=A0A2G8LLX8_STIJA|nr:hypothetical protein BSL78_01803 [Apostichopus japonicus]
MKLNKKTNRRKGDNKSVKEQKMKEIPGEEIKGKGDDERKILEEKKPAAPTNVEEERKPWQFWKKKGDEGSSTDPVSPVKPRGGDEAKSKTCVVL